MAKRQASVYSGSYTLYQGPPGGGMSAGGMQVAGKGLFGGFFKKLGKAGRGGDTSAIEKRIEKFQRKLDEAKAELAEAKGKSKEAPSEETSESGRITLGYISR